MSDNCWLIYDDLWLMNDEYGEDLLLMIDDADADDNADADADADAGEVGRGWDHDHGHFGSQKAADMAFWIPGIDCLTMAKFPPIPINTLQKHDKEKTLIAW